MVRKKKDILFSSWKEIAAYFDVSVKTCQRWEKKHGLPVHRLADSRRSGIMVYGDEFNRWLAGSFISRNGKGPKPERRSRFSVFLTGFLILFLVAAGTFFIWNLLRSPPLPADFSIRGSELVVLDKSGKELWYYDTGAEGLQSEEFYRKLFQHKRRKDNMLWLPILVIQDLDGDSLPEVVFAQRTIDLVQSDTLFVFNHRGKVIARIPTGREMVFGTTRYPEEFNVYGFIIADLESDGRREILLASNQNPFFPTRFMIIDCEGQIRGEYWNSGRVSDITVADLDEDGYREIMVSGINNEYRKAFFAIFGNSTLRGCSPQTEEKYRPRGLQPVSARYYVLLPRTDLDRLTHLMDNATEIKVHENGNIFVRKRHSSNYFVFDSSISPVTVLFSNQFTFAHRQAVKNNQLDSRLDEEYKSRLMENILYFDGKKWVSRPARANPDTGNSKENAGERPEWDV